MCIINDIEYHYYNVFNRNLSGDCRFLLFSTCLNLRTSIGMIWDKLFSLDREKYYLCCERTLSKF
ncbi:Hypothetical protein CKL_1600 [Clostridium kluyveri DSM 555]|uniref:Uncharacterized protein n=1 Tax=Clostridium kluyveri (strain ATCC 8527 / DSM 555 / NBRC 12016 / NCIMB 10680 / K1) TaxID=431943 RepID=A5N8L1_CLOK5|nr:Hypothetical protein CKL_1600 [Clostridium kluyveri DSM 555]